MPLQAAAGHKKTAPSPRGVGAGDGLFLHQGAKQGDGFLLALVVGAAFDVQLWPEGAVAARVGAKVGAFEDGMVERAVVRVVGHGGQSAAHERCSGGIALAGACAQGCQLQQAGVACFGIKRARGFVAASIKGSDENGKGCSGIQRLCGKGDV